MNSKRSLSPPRVARLRLAHLQMLEILAEVGSLRKVAERMHLSQPAVSQMVKQVEQAFGGQLLTRSRKRVYANDRMETLMRRVRAILRELSIAGTELINPEYPQSIVHVGANLHVLTRLIPKAISALRKQEPSLRFVLQEGGTNDLLQMVTDGEIDCAISRVAGSSIQAETYKQLSITPIYQGTLCILVSRKHPLYRRRSVTLKDLADADWATSSQDSNSRTLLADIFMQAGINPPTPVIECRPFAANLAIAEELPLVTMGMREEALHESRKAAFRALPLVLDRNRSPVSFICRHSKMHEFPLPLVRDAIIATARAAKLPSPLAQADRNVKPR